MIADIVDRYLDALFGDRPVMQRLQVDATSTPLQEFLSFPALLTITFHTKQSAAFRCRAKMGNGSKPFGVDPFRRPLFINEYQGFSWRFRVVIHRGMPAIGIIAVPALPGNRL